MAIPNAVKQQADKATNLIKDRKTGGEPPAPAPTSPAPASPSPTPAPAAATPPAPQPTPTPAPTPSPAAPADDWKHRHDVLQGKYNAEVPRLHNTVKELETKIEKLSTELQAVKTAPAPQPKPEFAPNKYITDKDLKDFDPEMVDMAKRAAREELEANLSPLLERILPVLLEPYLGKTLNPLKEQVDKIASRSERVETRVIKSAEDEFFDTLEETVKTKTGLTFDTINSHPAFLAWLGEKDPTSRRVRQALLDEARAAHDAEWAATFFTDFVSTNPNAVTAPAAPVTVPTRVGAEPPHNQTKSGTIWKRSDIDAFYKDVKLGKYRGRDAEKQQRENDIFAARREGRVIEG